jgi:hypothetical protein
VNRKGITSAPIQANINFDMDDLDYLGEVTGTAVQHYVLGIPYGRTSYNYGVVYNQFMGLQVQIPHKRVYSQALFNAISTRPDADFILPMASETKTNFMFLGRKETVTLKGKAFKIKSK